MREDNVYSFCNFGAKGDAAENVDGTDDSYAMLQAVRSIPRTGGVLTIEPFYYTHGNGDNRVIFLYLDGYKTSPSTAMVQLSNHILAILLLSQIADFGLSIAAISPSTA